MAARELYTTSLYTDAYLNAYWRCEDLTDSKGTSNLTGSNSPTFVPGKFGNAINLQAVSQQYAICADNAPLSITGDMSASFWVNFDSLPASGTYMAFLAKGDYAYPYSYFLGLYNTGGTQRYIYLNVCSTGTFQPSGDTLVNWSPSIGSWHHVAVTYKASTGKVNYYVNGTKQGAEQTTTLTSIADTNQDFSLGISYENGNTEKFLNGRMDDVALFSRVLGSSEINGLYTGSLPAELYYTSYGTDPNLKAYWRLDDYSDYKGVSNLTGSNSPTFSGGKFYNGINFGSSSLQYAFCADNSALSITGDMTILAWLKLAGTPASGAYIIAAKASYTTPYSYSFQFLNDSGLKLFYNVSNTGTYTADGDTSVTWSPFT